MVPELLDVAKRAKGERKLFLAAFKDFPLEHIDKLGDYGLALWAAEIELRRLEAEAKVRDRRPDEALVGGCRDQRKDLLDAAAYLWREDKTVRQSRGDEAQRDHYGQTVRGGRRAA